MSSYGRSIKPAVPFISRETRVRVGYDAPGPQQQGQAFNQTQKDAWSTQCGTGEKRAPLGTTPQSVGFAPGANSLQFSFASVVPFKVSYLDIDDAIASNLLISSIKFGLREIVTGGQISASSFNTRNGKDYQEVFDGCIIYPSIPAIVTVINISNAEVFFRGTMWGSALVSC